MSESENQTTLDPFEVKQALSEVMSEFFLSENQTTLDPFEVKQALSEVMSEFFIRVDMSLEKHKLTSDITLDIFKTLVPDLWDTYTYLAYPEFAKLLDGAINFSQTVAKTFNQRSKTFNSEVLEED